MASCYMNRRRRRRLGLAVIALALPAGAVDSAPAADVLLQPASQERCVAARSSDGYYTDRCDECAGDLEPFSGSCYASGGGTGRGRQGSRILDAALIGTGSGSSDHNEYSGSTSGDSEFNVVFDLPHRSAVTLVGQVAVFVDGYANPAESFLRLSDDSGKVVLETAVYEVGHGSEEGGLNERVLLEAGRYEFEAVADTGSYDGLAEASFAFELTVDVCLADADGDWDVDFDDILAVLDGWGPYTDCPPFIGADIDQDCEVGFNDLLIVLSGWGPCE